MPDSTNGKGRVADDVFRGGDGWEQDKLVVKLWTLMRMCAVNVCNRLDSPMAASMHAAGARVSMRRTITPVVDHNTHAQNRYHSKGAGGNVVS